MQCPKEITDMMIAEAKEDEVGLWLIHTILRRELKIEDKQELRDVTVECVRQLLRSDKIIAGQYEPPGPTYRPWNLDEDAAIARITKEWDELGHDPSIGEIVVFMAKENVR
jgi:hypothetical protein